MRYVLLFFCVAAFCFCCFFMFSGYDHLVNWFRGFNECFYRYQSWTIDFFTPAIKSTGNVYCTFALIVTSLSMFYLIKRIRRQGAFTPFAITIDTQNISLLSRCLLVATLFWIWGKSLVAPSNDEVFSAVYCAGMHPFQTVSYYMHPNNHMFFNLLNNVIFHSFSDKVLTGRFISLFCYWGVIIICYYWLASLLPKKWLAALLTITLALQFPMWGFSFQARGYELMAAAEWAAFISFFRYCFSGGKKWLYVFSVASVAGYFCMPTFLYLHCTILVFSFIYQVINRKVDRFFWECQFVTASAVFLLYLPCLCFSGLRSLTANQYVTGNNNFGELFGIIIPTFKNYLDYCFFRFIMKDNTVDFILFLLPLCLLFYKKNKTAIFLGWFFIATWASCIMLAFIMKIFPVDRALIWQFSFTLALSMYSVYLLISSLADQVHLPVLSIVVVPLLLVLVSVNFVIKGKTNAAFSLCHFEVNPWNLSIAEGITNIPIGSSVAFSDESFYWYYLCEKSGYNTSKCIKGNEDYYVKYYKDQFRDGMEVNYTTLKNLELFTIYKRK